MADLALAALAMLLMLWWIRSVAESDGEAPEGMAFLNGGLEERQADGRET